ncbi:hypothetical protein DFH06DRAFT_1320979 [Mycena polygramma]|nr:hypothetical protein DFH06DRAFT_1320979 [Mycena polygramma]
MVRLSMQASVVIRVFLASGRTTCSGPAATPCRSPTGTPGNPVLPVIANTASFSGMPNPPNNPQPLVLSSPQGFGSLFYKLESDDRPVVTFCGTGGAVNAYAFVAKAHLSGLGAVNTPSHSLYRLSTSSVGPIPTTNMEGSSFWSSSQIGYGTAASVVRNGFVSCPPSFMDGAANADDDRRICTARPPT